jgi:hypothetical protein
MKMPALPRLAAPFVGIVLAALALAQEPAPAPAVPADVAPPAAVLPAPAAAAAAAAPAVVPLPVPASPALPEPAPEMFREQTIYIPYEDLRKTFEKSGRGVFLPYEEFQKLWQAARAAAVRPATSKPPVDNLVSEITGEATVAKDVINVKAKVRIELLKEGWNRVPIQLGDVAISKATIRTAPARLLAVDGGYALLVENPAKTPQIIELDLEFARAYTKSPGRNSVSFAAPVTAVSRWDIRIPEPGVKVDVQPLLAATEVPVAKDALETRVQAFVGATPSVRIEWTPKSEGAKGLTVLASVQAETRVTIDEGVTRTRVELEYAVSRAELPQLRVEVPADQKIVNVFDPNVREWSVAAVEGVQCITAQLFEPAREKQSLVLELERFAAEAGGAVPCVKALDVGRQQGVVVVRLAAGLRAEALKRESLLQLDAGELPARLTGEPWDFAYRYAALPFALVLRVEKILPRLLVDTLVEAHVQPEQLVVDVRSIIDVQRAGVFQFVFLTPPDWEVRSVRGETAENATPAEIAGHHRVDGQPGKLVVNLSRQASGRVALALQLHRRLAEPDLLTPSGKAAAIALSIPRADPDSVFRETGRLVVYGPDSLRFNPRDPKGLRTISPAEALQGFGALPAPAGERPVMAFAFGVEPASLTVEAERRKPHITVRQLLTVRLESGVARFEALFFCDVLYSGIKSLRLDLPKALADQVRITASGIRHEVMDDPAVVGDLAPETVAWRISGETEFIGVAVIPLVWEQKLEKLDVGGSVDLVIPHLTPRAVDRAWGQIILAKAESIDVVPTETRAGLRAIDPQHDLMPGAAGREAARAFEFLHDDWSLTVRATRYEAKDVKATSIERALITAVATRGEVTSIQAIYRMRSARQRLTVKLPGEVEFDTQPLHINGRPVPLEQGAGSEFFIPLTAQAQNTPFLVELRYTVRGPKLHFEGPGFPQEPATQRVFLSVFLPQELTYLGARGAWNDELVWVLRGFSSWPRSNRSQESLYQWVSEGLDSGTEGLASFATDGRHVLFSTLRPPAGAAGALQIRAVQDLWVQMLVIVAGVALGLVLLPATLSRRALVCGLVATLLLLLAVFLPSLARALVSNAAVAGAMIVLIAWGLWYVVVTRPRRQGAPPAGPAASPPPAAPMPPPLPPPAAPDPEAGTGQG